MLTTQLSGQIRDGTIEGPTPRNVDSHASRIRAASRRVAPASGALAMALPASAKAPPSIDFARPSAGLVPRALSSIINGFEPPSIASWLDDKDPEIRAAGFEPGPHLSLADGFATAILATPARHA